LALFVVPLSLAYGQYFDIAITAIMIFHSKTNIMTIRQATAKLD